MSITKNGMRDWLLQRVTAIWLGIFTVGLVGYFVNYYPVTYSDWHSLFNSLYMQIACILTLLSFLIHAWIGVWTVLTDYVKPALLRFTLHSLVVATLIGYFFWAVMILWGK